VRPSAPAVLDQLLDPAGFDSWDVDPVYPDLDPAYRAELTAAAERTGCDEAVLTGSGRIEGHRVALVVSEFGFLGGSIGVATSARIRAAVERATRERLPLLALPASGGTRMQEGTAAFLEMIEITRTVLAHRQAGLPYLTYLRNPTTGGVLASWGSLGDLTFAEPGALIGFLGPKVYEALEGEPFPAGVQTAENLARHGLVDQVIDLRSWRRQAAKLLGHLAHPVHQASLSVTPGPAPTQRDAWGNVEATRKPGRPSARDILARCTDLVRVGDDVTDSLFVVIARVDGTSAVVVGQDRIGQERQPLGVDALRLARRGVQLAQRLSLPLVALIDTAGAELSPNAEDQGLAHEIAECIAAMVSLTVPSVSVLLGQGAGGGALALFPAARRIGVSDAWLTPLPPEGASAIVCGSTEQAPQIARAQGIDTATLAHQRHLNTVLSAGSDSNVEVFAAQVLAAVRQQLTDQRK
jgi:acyl-CoA carboxylase subunit beta